MKHNQEKTWATAEKWDKTGEKLVFYANLNIFQQVFVMLNLQDSHGFSAISHDNSTDLLQF